MSLKSILSSIFDLLTGAAENWKATLDEARERYRYASLEDLYRKHERTSSSKEKIILTALINERERRAAATNEDE